MFEPHVKSEERDYAYLLVVNKRVVKCIAHGWWSDDHAMRVTAGAMATASRVFKKSACILVYEYGFGDDGYGLWHFVHSCKAPTDLAIDEYLSPMKIDDLLHKQIN